VRFDRAVKGLRKLLGQKREYDILDEAAEQQGAGYLSGWVLSSCYSRVMRLKDRLLREYEGVSLEEAIPGEVVSSEVGECYLISSECGSEFCVPSKRAREAIVSNLKFLYGIGEKTEAELKKRGYRTIVDLTRHPKWRKAAREFLRLLDMNDCKRLQEVMWRGIPKSHPLSFRLAGLKRDEEFAIIDIETMGLFHRPIILLGVARPRGGRLRVNQYLVRDVSEENAALKAFTEELEGCGAIVSFNGSSFDVPFVEQRLNYYGLGTLTDKVHFDLLHFVRRVWRGRIPNCSLPTVEESVLGLRRRDEVPGVLVPEFYREYLETGNVGPLVAIINHNRQDVTSLAHLFSKLSEALGYDL